MFPTFRFQFHITFLVVFFHFLGNSIITAQGLSLEKAEALVEKGHYEMAIVVIDKLIEKEPNRATYYAYKATYQMLLFKDYDNAIITLDQAIERLPDSLMLYHTKGSALAELHRDEERAACYSQALLRPNLTAAEQSSLLSVRAGAEYAMGNKENARKDAELAIALDSSNLIAVNNAALVYMRAGEHERALDVFYRTIQIDSNFIGGHMNIGFTYQLMEKYEESLEWFNYVINRNAYQSWKGIASVYNNRGYSLLMLGRLDEAEKDILIAIELDPLNSYAYRNLALLQLEKGNKEKACEALETSQQLGFTEKYTNEVEELLSEHCNDRL